ncbi:MAG: NYN domain-containing protein [Chlamydiae bacterium]|nr:NYN domain-containing protein [Chlamydiota bacterium]
MYYIDGYNLLFSIIEEKPIEKTRIELIDLLSGLVADARLSATVIFDNLSELSTSNPTLEYHSSLSVLFSPRGLCADKYILEILHGLENTRLATVVTSDVSLANHSKMLGAKVVSNEQFLKFLSRKTRKKEEHKIPFQGKRELERLRIIFEERYNSIALGEIE